MSASIAAVPTTLITVGELVLNTDGMGLEVGGQPVKLTMYEFGVLQHLMLHADQVVTREALARDIYGESTRGAPPSNVLEVIVSRIRKKLDAVGSARVLHTVWGTGYRLQSQGGAA